MKLRYFPFSVFLFTLLLMPAAAKAGSTVWNMEGIEKLEGWNHKNFSSIGLTPDGLVIRTSEQGQLARQGNIRHKVDTIAITYSSPSGANGIFFWQPRHLSGNNAFNIPMNFSPSLQTTTMVLDVSNIKEWDPSSTLIGFNFNAGTNITLKKIEFSGPSFIDTFKSSLHSIFVFDEYKSYTVNFLWGPRLVPRMEFVDKLYHKAPPYGTSWNTVLYYILAVAFLVSFIVFRKKHTNWLRVFIAVFAVFWLMYDARMGAEIVQYAKTDWKEWWSKPIEMRIYRDRSSFPVFTELAASMIEEDDAYALITKTGWPYFGMMRYETYPTLPLSTSDDLSNVRHWFVYRMPNVRINEENRITLDGEAISPPGEVLLLFEKSSFMFRTTQ